MISNHKMMAARGYQCNPVKLNSSPCYGVFGALPEIVVCIFWCGRLTNCNAIKGLFKTYTGQYVAHSTFLAKRISGNILLYRMKRLLSCEFSASRLIEKSGGNRPDIIEKNQLGSMFVTNFESNKYIF